MTHDARRQGGLLSYEDLALLLGVSGASWTPVARPRVGRSLRLGHLGGAQTGIAVEVQ